MRTIIYSAIFLFLAINVLNVKAQNAEQSYVFEPLPYSFNALEKAIDAQTMEIHWDRHHRGYYNNFVAAIKETNMNGKSLEEIFAQISKLPVSIRNNGGGHYNHTLFWKIMSPDGGEEPKGKLAKAINETFGSFENFKKTFEQTAMTRFGSGWAWLSVNNAGKLFVSSTPNQDNPLMDVVEQKGTPILGLDVWEHAYYLKYQNKRAGYISAFWSVVNWNEVEKRYESLVK